ncbi:MAG: LicD family protein, partial [Muribaculaceae bacterium]|nr:LicD family protein [Muribaculaceae bacterium]
NLDYVISSGTLLGAVRHKGYIPWDDDADIMMLREDYERFKTVMGDLNPDICFFQDHTTDPGYRWGYGKLRRTGTEYVRVGQEHMKNKTGINVDVFPYDDVPQSTLGQMIQDFYCYCCRKILWSEVGKENSHGFMKLWWSLLSKISVERVYKWLDFYIKKSKNKAPNKVRILCFTAIGKLYYKHPLKDRYGIPKQWFTERAEFEFEGYKLMGTKDYDACMKFWYGDYMKLPPEDQREQHAPVSYISFGDAPKNYNK